MLEGVSHKHGPPERSSTVIRIASEVELGVLAVLDPGTVAERLAAGGDVWRYIAAGLPDPAVRAVLGWNRQNVWLRQEEYDYILTKRASLMPDLSAAITHVLGHPLSVHENPHAAGTTYFLCDGNSLRGVSWLQSSRVGLVDLVVEPRPVLGGSFLRVVHCSPTRRGFGGRQLWP